MAAQPRPTADLSSIKPIDTSKLKSTYAKLFVTFTKGHFGVPDMLLNKGLAGASKVYAEFGRLAAEINESSDDASIRAVAREMLEKLRTATTPAAQATYTAVTRDAEPLFKASEDLEKKGSLLQKKFAEDEQKVFATLQTVLTSIANARDPEEKSRSQEIMNQMVMTERTHKAIAQEMQQLKDARLVSNSRLKDIFQKSFDAMPNKSGLPSLPTRPGETPEPRR